MALIRFDPIRGFETIARKMGDIAGEFEKGFSFEYGSYSPRVDISEDEKNLFFNVELPGVKKEDVKLSIDKDNVLSIKGDKKRDEKFKDEIKEFCCIRVERSFGEFNRSFKLPENINRDSISAKFDNGVLSISLEKIEPEKPKEVEIAIS